jgi:signal transduction histidine kinase
MDRVRQNIAQQRAHTDASLDAERSGADDVATRCAEEARRTLDDLIERDRLAVDARLKAYRRGADRELSRQREESPARDSVVGDERAAADAGTQAEREDMDAVLDRERRRSDDAVELHRQQHTASGLTLEAQREETNAQLSTERSGVDGTVFALSSAREEGARRADVFAMVTHDLRSPLSIIALNAQNIAECTNEVGTREAAEDMVRAGARMERLLSDLLDVARIESNSLRIVKELHDVGALMTEVGDSYRPLFTARGMTLSVGVPPRRVVAFFDHDRIVQVLSNLLSNAMKFGRTGGKIDIHVEQRAQDIELVASDDGPGIDPAALPHVFDRFWRIDHETRRGLGLGLYICQKIVEAHGGRISAESEVGHGATFRFCLPAGTARANESRSGSMMAG